MFLCILFGILLQGVAFEDLDVVGEADIETADTFHAAYFGGEIPDVIVAFMSFDAVLGSGIFLHEQILGHQVKLE